MENIMLEGEGNSSVVHNDYGYGKIYKPVVYTYSPTGLVTTNSKGGDFSFHKSISPEGAKLILPIYNYLTKEKGISENLALALIANSARESGIDPRTGIVSTKSYSNPDKVMAGGLFQIDKRTSGGKVYKDFLNYAKQRGVDPTDYKMQIDYFLDPKGYGKHYLKYNAGTLAYLRNNPDITAYDMANAILRDVERPEFKNRDRKYSIHKEVIDNLSEYLNLNIPKEVQKPAIVNEAPSEATVEVPQEQPLQKLKQKGEMPQVASFPSPLPPTSFSNPYNIQMQKDSIKDQYMLPFLPPTSNVRINQYAYGGLVEYNKGGSHEENPYQGIHISNDDNGKPNLVEQGETKYNDFIFSKRIKPIDSNALTQFGLPKRYAGKSYADISKSLNKEYLERPNDAIYNKYIEQMMEKLKESQEYSKEEMNKRKADKLAKYLKRNGYTEEDMMQLLYPQMAQQGMQDPNSMYGPLPQDMYAEGGYYQDYIPPQLYGPRDTEGYDWKELQYVPESTPEENIVPLTPDDIEHIQQGQIQQSRALGDAIIADAFNRQLLQSSPQLGHWLNPSGGIYASPYTSYSSYNPSPSPSTPAAVPSEEEYDEVDYVDDEDLDEEEDVTTKYRNAFLKAKAAAIEKPLAYAYPKKSEDIYEPITFISEEGEEENEDNEITTEEKVKPVNRHMLRSIEHLVKKHNLTAGENNSLSKEDLEKIKHYLTTGEDLWDKEAAGDDSVHEAEMPTKTEEKDKPLNSVQRNVADSISAIDSIVRRDSIPMIDSLTKRDSIREPEPIINASGFGKEEEIQQRMANDAWKKWAIGLAATIFGAYGAKKSNKFIKNKYNNYQRGRALRNERELLHQEMAARRASAEQAAHSAPHTAPQPHTPPSTPKPATPNPLVTSEPITAPKPSTSTSSGITAERLRNVKSWPKNNGVPIKPDSNMGKGKAQRLLAELGITPTDSHADNKKMLQEIYNQAMGGNSHADGGPVKKFNPYAFIPDRSMAYGDPSYQDWLIAKSRDMGRQDLTKPFDFGRFNEHWNNNYYTRTPYFDRKSFSTSLTETPTSTGNTNTGSNNGGDKGKDYSPYLRFLPIAASGAAVLGDLFSSGPNYQDSERVERMASEMPYMSRSNIGRYAEYTPYDRNYAGNRLIGLYGANQQVLRNNYSGSPATMVAGMLANTYNNQQQLAGLDRQAQEYNTAMRMQALQQNNQIDQYNDQANMQVQQANIGRHQAITQAYLQSAALRQREAERYSAARSNNLSNFVNSIGNFGREAYNRNVSNGMFRSYDIDPLGNKIYKKTTNRYGG